MDFVPFVKEDFEVFQIDGLEARMDELKKRVRPKLEALGQHFAPTLSALTGDEIFYHVAKHARRTVHPPNDTWVAFANSKRGYKKLPHFQIGLWSTHVFVWFAIIYESPVKEEIGKQLLQNWQQIRKQIPEDYFWSADHTKPDAEKQKNLSDEDFQRIFQRLQSVKKAEMLCGINLPKNEVLSMSREQFLEKVDETFKTLMPLYQITQKSTV
ncbi:DUF1054 domain-containing protein [Aeribacillus sp. FSL K6-8394]|uniref:YktB family protein n=1 Tax=Aeribacillus sp. FSL K6-8394 TaxID=2954570 RepID=UPI0030FC90EF